MAALRSHTRHFDTLKSYSKVTLSLNLQFFQSIEIGILIVEIIMLQQKQISITIKKLKEKNTMLVSQFKNRPASSIINFDELFDELFNSRNNMASKNFMPAVNISESDASFHLDMAIPSFTKEDVTITLDKKLLTISGKKNEETTDETKKVKRKEFHYKSFSRSFTLPENIQAEKVEAKYENGVLILNIPKTEVEKEKSVVEVKIS